jgi:prepilin-type N-terminal cleavage/methylation domain-containing protein
LGGLEVIFHFNKKACMHFTPSIHQSRRHAAFTLVELLVVIVIIAALAGISFTTVKSIKERANESTSAANMRQIGIAMQSYVSDKGAYPRPGDRDSPEFQVSWDRIIMNNLGSPDFNFLTGRSDPIRKDSPESAALGNAVNILYCPGDETPAPSGQFRRSYALCPWVVSNRGPGFSNGFPGFADGIGPPPTLIAEPHRAVLAIEFQSREGGPQNTIGSGNYGYLFGFRPMPQDIGPAEYHKKNQLLLFVDGHVLPVPGNITQSEWVRNGYSPHVQP